MGQRWVGFGKWVAPALAAVVLAGGCSHPGPTIAGATVPTAPTTTSTTVVADAFAMPADTTHIDAAYTEGVLNALKHVSGDITRRIYQRQAFDQSDLVTLRAIYNDPELSVQAQVVPRLTSSRSDQQDPPGDNHVSVTRLIDATPACIAVAATIDVSATVKQPPPPYATWIVLRPTQAGANPDRVNPTPWSIANQDVAKEITCATQ